MNVLISVADTPQLDRALRAGTLLAQITSAKVTLLHVLGKDESAEAGQDLLSQASAQLNGVQHETRLEEGKAANVILRVADEGGYDLIVLGARRKSVEGDLSVGRVARQVLTQASVSTLVVKGAPETLDRVLVCSGGRPVAEPVVNMGANLAQVGDAKLTLLHVSSAVPSMYTGLDAMDENIEDLMQSDTPEAQHLRQSAELFKRHGLEAVLELRHGVAIDEIIRSCQLREYDLLLIGAADAAPFINRLLFGQLTQNIVDRSPVSVLVVRATE